MKLKNLLHNDLFIFDLDRTIWDTYDRYGNPVWAKQMLPPYDFETFKDEDIILDDVGSRCELHPGIREIIVFLKQEKKKITFLSSGGIKGKKLCDQPSFLLLKLFGIGIYDGIDIRLMHKTCPKQDFFLYEWNGEKCVVFDDDVNVIKSIKKLKIPEITCIDRFDVGNWSDML